ncbi:RmlC-like cupin domain-containing protein [Lobosporangium transversale]|uniref:RmlC-like cupin domain-containing protein n=1 Tax=Lobosporangium transversale TaxID=64571 RepID=A0A1Y2GFI8_9FUNG|nr:RmlC-like cupin domain-containing protein [Lobosporangium transversale]ORZ06288.1 RmlC-like cupin domain-containing protein [Lobosporangium transversale]|eukprot:XP_021877451.1 RmlC-like cupin domain-containing protein [Lobosporangium transversale]
MRSIRHPSVAWSAYNSTTPKSSSRSILKAVLSAEQAEGQGARVRRSIGRPELRNHDPFLMLDEFLVDKNGGFPDHPHRGFETVTYMLEGQFQHEDFAGHKGTIGPGDLQWMTAGRGIVHSEMPVKSQDRAHGLQLWINLPKEHKMCKPQYQELLDKEIPRAMPEDGVVIKVIAGESHGVRSKVYTRTPTMYLDFKMDMHKTVEQTIPASYTGFIYTLKGTVFVGDDGFEGRAHHTLTFSEDGKELVKVSTRDEDAHFVLIAGEPLREPIIQYGPFVMNSQEEIYETFEDYQHGKNGFERARNWKSDIAQI